MYHIDTANNRTYVKLDTTEHTFHIRDVHNDTIWFEGTLRSLTTGDSIQPGDQDLAHKWPRTRSHISIKNCSNLVLMNIKVRGPHINGGTGNDAFVGRLEAQHALQIADSENIIVHNAKLSHIYGDGIYLRRVKNVQIYNSHIHHNGRQGIALVDVNGVILSENKLEHIRRAHIDIENNSDREVVENIIIDNNTFGPSRLKWIANGGRGTANNIRIINNTLDGKDFDIHLGKNNGTSNVTIIGNVSNKRRGNPQGMIMKFFNVTNVYISDNVVPAQKGRNMYILGCYNCKDVILRENDVPDGYNEIKIE